MSDQRLGFIQLCADRRFHRATMDAFEACAGLAPDEYWIEASAGGAAAIDHPTATAKFAYEQGARLMGWAAHGDRCGGFPGRPNADIRARLKDSALARAKEFPDAEHWLLFGQGGSVEVVALT